MQSTKEPLDSTERTSPVESINALSNAPKDVDFIEEDLQSRVSKPLWALIVLTVLSSTFLFALDNTVVADVQAPIVESLSGVDKLSWLGVAFILASSATIVTFAKLYGTFSAKWLYIGSVVLFEGGSALCGAAPSMNAMIVGRVLAGLGGSGMYLGCLTLLSLTTSLRQRPNYLATIGLTWGLGTVLGPIVGGAFAQNKATTWRWAFYINLVIGAVFAPIYIIFLPVATPNKHVPMLLKFKQLDYCGIVLNVGAFTCLVMAINFGGNLYEWNAGPEIALWTVGGVLLVLFGLQQAYCIGTTIKDRIFPSDFLRRPIMWLLFIMACCAASACMVPTFYIPLYFQFVRGESALTAAIRLLPFVCVMVFFGFVSAGVMAELGYYMPWYLFGGVFTTIGGALMYTVDEHSANSRIYGYTVLIGIGAGSFVQASFAVAQAKVSMDRLSDAGGYIALGQNVGIVSSLAISGAVFHNEAVKNLHKVLPEIPKGVLTGAIAGANSELLKGLSDELRGDAIHAIVKAMSKTYTLVIAAGALCLVGSLFMKREKIFVKPGAVM